ncbi:MAG: DUF6602 domain-containing protein [Nostoc sp.]|uniref:DUF6602 domain-containing protein n=1 Tax=Nostoc sp. TaxID=1180 RepID=UPI002FFC5B0F
MVHPVYKTRIEADIKRLISTSYEIDNIKHKGLRGAFRESSLGKLLQSYLPFGWDLGSGEIIDYLGETSSEIDLLIYNKASIPPILFSESQGCYPVESCFYVFEIKTTSNASQIQETIEKFKKLRQLKRLAPRKTITVYFAYNTDLKEKSEFERYAEYDANFGDDPLIDVLCVIGQGYWFHVKDSHSITWCFFKAQQNHFEVGLFLSGIINTINKINSQQPFGYYVVENINSSKIIYHRDFLRDFDIPFDKGDLFTNGYREHELGNYSAAINFFLKSIQEQRKLASFLVKLATESFERKNYQAIIEYTNKAIDLYPPLKYNYRLFHRRGIAYFQLDQLNRENSENLVAKSINDFNFAIKLNPANPELRYCLACSKLRIAGFDRSLLTDALNSLNKAIELNPLYEEALVLRGTTYSRLGQFAEARDTYVKAMGINSANEEILKNLIIQEYNLSLCGEQNTLISHEELGNWMQGNYEDK